MLLKCLPCLFNRNAACVYYSSDCNLAHVFMHATRLHIDMFLMYVVYRNYNLN